MTKEQSLKHPSVGETIARLGKAALALLCLLPVSSPGAQFPLWEAGAGVAAISFPDYRGSNERQSYFLPVPYFVYRGDFLKVEDHRVRGMFYRSDKAEVDVSINGSVPVKSEDNEARRGMPDLDPTLEVGPSLNFFLHRAPDKKYKLDLRLPLRAVIASDFSHVKHVGWILQPNLNIDVRDFPAAGWHLGLLGGPVFGDRRYHQYIYGVEPAHVTGERPAYNARGGYAGSQFIAALSKRYPNYWVGGFLKWDTLNGAVFADSPLVKSKRYFTGGIAVSWVFSRSKTKVEAEN
ncbi:MAG: MipA/OmpV family protein [Burkholderiales bacterium]|nr:MipA/OmpV family protein [Burkholderiales bacterium]